MAVIDLIFKMDNKRQLKEVYCMGECKDWLEDKIWCDLIGQKIDYILGISIIPEEGIVEIKSKFFKYQRVKEIDEEILYLSRDGVLFDLYKQAIKHVAEGIQIYDRNGYFLHANPVSEALEHYKIDDFKGKHLLDIYDLEEEYSTVLSVLRTQKAVVNRCDRFKMRNGKTLTTINSGYPLRIDNELYGAVVLESDLSVLKQIKNRTFNLEAYVESRQPRNKASLYNFDDIIHTSEGMKNVIHFAKKVSLTESGILIVGDTGTGKELMAQSIHSFSPRRHKPFIDVNCGAIPTNLFESMFFGTEKGAFTGSVTKQGFFEMAEGGTLFLDEVNSISIENQAKLLRVLQEKRFQRIGGSKYIHCDVRIIAASNEDIYELLEKQKIRRDFYYRISTIKIDLPFLGERKEDIPLLATHFLNQLCIQYNREKIKITKKVIDAFFKYDWPGNVRELHHVLEYAFNHMPEDATILESDDLPTYLQTLENITDKSESYCETTISSTTDNVKLREQMKKFEQSIIIETLDRNGGNITKSAKELGMSRQSLQHRIRKLGLFIK